MHTRQIHCNIVRISRTVSYNAYNPRSELITHNNQINCDTRENSCKKKKNDLTKYYHKNYHRRHVATDKSPRALLVSLSRRARPISHRDSLSRASFCLDEKKKKKKKKKKKIV